MQPKHVNQVHQSISNISCDDYIGNTFAFTTLLSFLAALFSLKN